MKTTNLLLMLSLILAVCVGSLSGSPFLTMPFSYPDIKLQQGWVYTAPIGINPEDPYAHNGIDYIKGQIDVASTWEPFDVVAAADGVAMRSSGSGYGDFVLIRHNEKDALDRNYFTLYAHLGSTVAGIVERDRFATDYDTWTPVGRGQKVGVVGDTGSPGLIHLHFEVNRGGYAQNKVDPYDIYSTRHYYPDGSFYEGMGTNQLWLSDAPDDAVILDVPHVHQVYHTPDEFNGTWACGATSAVMIVAYWGEVAADPLWVSYDGGRWSDYGRYISRTYTNSYDHTFDLATILGNNRDGTGAWGFIHRDDSGPDPWTTDGYARAWRTVAYFQNHGLQSQTIMNPSEAQVKAEIDAGNPVWASTTLTAAGHIVVIRGYDSDGYYISDPWGNPHSPDYESTWGSVYSGRNVKVTWADLGTAGKWIVTAEGQMASPPEPPASISYPISSSTGHYVVSWASSDGATSYQLERSNDGGGSWARIYSGGSISYSDAVVSGSYRYRVRALNSGGASNWRTGTYDCIVSIVGAPIPPESIAYPVSSKTGNYTIDWSSSGGATSYQLERSNDGGSTWTQVYSGWDTFFNESVGNGGFTYRVRASNSMGSSTWRTGSHECVVNTGLGTETDPFMIGNVQQLQAMRHGLNAWYKLANDIDASETAYWNQGAGFLPVGTSTHPFTGNLDGDGYTISNLYINRSGEDRIGLFGTTLGTSISNLKISNANIEGRDYAGVLVGVASNSSISNFRSISPIVVGRDVIGGVAGSSSSSIISCHSISPIVNGRNRVGGLIGDQSGQSVINCQVSKGDISGSTRVGGLVGSIFASNISDSTVDVSVSATSTDSGGFAGYVFGGELTNSHSLGKVVGTSNVGGFAGTLTGRPSASTYPIVVSNCSSQVSVTATGNNVGGLAGYSFEYVTITTSHAKITISGNNYVGGLIGYNHRRNYITLCYATGYVNGYNYVGGLVGMNDLSVGYQIISSYATCIVSGSGSVGGFIGYHSGPGSISQCFATSQVESSGDGSGGFVGVNASSITNCFATGSVVGGTNFTGGFVGEALAASTMSNCYSAGSVAGLYNIGGFAGYNSGTDTACFWDLNTSGVGVSGAGTPKTTAEMRQQITFNPPWNLATIWGIDEGSTYPYLRELSPKCGDPWHRYPLGDLNFDCRVDLLDLAILASNWMTCTAPECN